jgi:hypothetical protein
MPCYFIDKLFNDYDYAGLSYTFRILVTCEAKEAKEANFEISLFQIPEKFFDEIKEKVDPELQNFKIYKAFAHSEQIVVAKENINHSFSFKSVNDKNGLVLTVTSDKNNNSIRCVSSKVTNFNKYILDVLDELGNENESYISQTLRIARDRNIEIRFIPKLFTDRTIFSQESYFPLFVMFEENLYFGRMKHSFFNNFDAELSSNEIMIGLLNNCSDQNMEYHFEMLTSGVSSEDTHCLQYGMTKFITTNFVVKDESELEESSDKYYMCPSDVKVSYDYQTRLRKLAKKEKNILASCISYLYKKQ